MVLLKFTPLEFETKMSEIVKTYLDALKFTPLEFETNIDYKQIYGNTIKIYSVGVWNDVDAKLAREKSY